MDGMCESEQGDGAWTEKGTTTDKRINAKLVLGALKRDIVKLFFFFVFF